MSNLIKEENMMWFETTKGPFEYNLLLLKPKVAEIENWKHCSKIIFKCVNSVVRPNFKEKVAEHGTCGSREQCMRPTGKNTSTGKCASQTEA